MRRRVLLATISAVVVAVVLLGIPLGFMGAQWAGEMQNRGLRDRLNTLVASVQAAQERAAEVEQDVTDVISERSLTVAVEGRTGNAIPAFVRIVLPGGDTIERGVPIGGPVLSVVASTDANAQVFMEVSAWTARVQMIQVVGLVAITCLIAIAAGAAVAVRQSNRLSAPLVYLAASAEQLGSGLVRPQVEQSGIEEIDLVASELTRSADRLAGHLASARQFTSDASHQLRTPLTALTMRLEEIMLTSSEPDVQEEARVSLEQVERLVSVVDDLLAASKRTQGGTTEPVRLADVVRQLAEEWTPTYLRANRRLTFEVPGDQRVLATPGALSQVLATLLENSLKYGDGVTTIRSRPSGTTGAVALEIGDEGQGVSDEIASRIFERGFTSGKGTGLGLAIARDLAAADGGRIELSQRRPAVFTVFLAGVPKTLNPSVLLPAGTSISSRR
ncbi:MAG: HAMP domain-containing histidine kinase [Promicromonosporaceae bacterium]|nr:HAMP domain-containing histidine kinase [Promicromonosporaceae bacterium]